MKRPLAIVVVAILIPQVALAAWWNPFSWRKSVETDSEKVELMKRVEELENRMDSEASTSIDMGDNYLPKKNEKTTSQMTTANNTDLQNKINELITENNSLQTKLNLQSSLVNQLNSCKADLVEARALSPKMNNNSTESVTNSMCSEAKENFKIASDKKFEIEAWYLDESAKISGNGSITKGAQVGLISNLNLTKSSKLAPVNLDIDKASVNMQLYCD